MAANDVCVLVMLNIYPRTRTHAVDFYLQLLCFFILEHVLVLGKTNQHDADDGYRNRVLF